MAPAFAPIETTTTAVIVRLPSREPPTRRVSSRTVVSGRSPIPPFPLDKIGVNASVSPAGSDPSFGHHDRSVRRHADVQEAQVEGLRSGLRKKAPIRPRAAARVVD